MVSFSKVNSTDNSKALTYKDFGRIYEENNNDASIFVNSNASIDATNIDILNEKLVSVEDKQGIFSKGWNSFKELTNIGTSVEKCDEAIEKYKNGEITFEEASKIIDNFEAKQESSLNLFSNIVTSAAAIGSVALAAVLASTGVGIPAAIAIGAGAGAATKAVYKFTDRATNEVEGDALNGKQIARDALSGAVTGGIATATMGTGSASTNVVTSVVKGAKTGATTGAIAGSSNYVIDCAFDDEKEFNFKDFATTTAVSTTVGATVGGIMGGVNSTLHNKYTSTTSDGKTEGFAGCNLETMIKRNEITNVADNATVENIATNSASSAFYKIGNDRIRAIANV